MSLVEVNVALRLTAGGLNELLRSRTTMNALSFHYRVSMSYFLFKILYHTKQSHVSFSILTVQFLFINYCRKEALSMHVFVAERSMAHYTTVDQK